MWSVQQHPILPFSSFPPFLPSFLFFLRRPRSCPHFFFFFSTCLPSFLFSRPPEPNTCVSREFQERGPGCRRKQSVTSSLSRGVDTSHSLPPLWRARTTPEIVFLEGTFAAHSLFRRLGTFLSVPYCTYTHIQTQLGAHSCTHRHRKHIVLLAYLLTSMGCLVVVSRDNPLTTTRWPALTHQCNDLAANHGLCNIHEWKQGWMVE